MADSLEDLGWFVIDNLPTPLIPKVAELAIVPESSIDRVALVVGSGAYEDDILPALNRLRSSPGRVRMLFLEASTDALVRRYESTRRRHPRGAGDRLATAVEEERVLLEAVKEEADLIVDTTDLNIHQLKARIVDLFGSDSPESGMQTTILSFGYKHGVPTDVDLVLDCRFLPNPYWVDELRPLTGLDATVREYVLGQDTTAPFLHHLDALLDLLLPEYVAEGKAYLTIAFGCTGGRHRSVVIAGEVATRLQRRGITASVKHRDVER